MKKTLFALAATAALLAARTASADATYSVDPAASVVKFHLEHKMHKIDGKSTQVEGKALLADDGKVRTMIRIPVASFDTADANRDSHMRETLDAAKFPFVVFKGVASLPSPVATGKAMETKLEGELDFHGVKKPLSVPAAITLGADGSASVSAKFPVDLDLHQIERPSLLFIKVDQFVQLDAELKLKK